MLQEVSSRVQDKAAVDSLRRLLEANKELAQAVLDGYLRQADYSRNMDRLRDELKQKEETIRKWQEWAAANFDYSSNMTYGEKKAREELARLKKELERYKASSAQQVDESLDEDEEVDSAPVKARTEEKEAKGGKMSEQDSRRYVTAEDLQRMGMAFEELYAKLEEFAADYQQRFGQPLNKREFMNFAKQYQDIDQAWAMYTMPKEIEHLRQKYESEIEKLKEEHKKELESLKEKATEEQLPVTTEPPGIPPQLIALVGKGSTAPAPEADHLERATEKMAASGFKRPPMLGKGVLSKRAAEELRQRGTLE